jgi:hypothetical protein
VDSSYKRITEIITKKLKKGNVPNLRFPRFEGEWEPRNWEK